jgi:hypothetical protein
MFLKTFHIDNIARLPEKVPPTHVSKATNSNLDHIRYSIVALENMRYMTNYMFTMMNLVGPLFYKEDRLNILQSWYY